MIVTHGDADCRSVRFGRAIQKRQMEALCLQAPRLTDVTFGGASVLTQHSNGQLTILASYPIYLPMVKK